jgi:hypothetical protein
MEFLNKFPAFQAGQASTNVSSDSGILSTPKVNLLQGVNIDILRNLQDQQAQSQSALQTSQNSGLNIYGVYRVPWVFATFDEVNGTATNPNPVVWVANPKSVGWTINQRGSETKNKSGTVLYMYRDSLRKTDYDDPKIRMEFQAGNIAPQAQDATKTSGSLDTNQISGGLNNFYQFLSLVDNSKIATNGQANVIHILYRSRIFPSMVLTGFFDPQMIVQFSDDSNDPYRITSWSATFTVYSTTPRLNNYNQLIQRFQSEGFTGFTQLNQTNGTTIDTTQQNPLNPGVFRSSNIV